MTLADSTSHNSWLTRRRPVPAPRFRLFCYPHAGSSASAFAAWSAALPHDVDVVGIQPPGRERRAREAPFAALEPVIEELLAALASADELTVPFGFAGNSLGALVVFELTRALRRAGLQMPSALWVVGRRAPHVRSRDPIDPTLPAAILVKALARAGSPFAQLDADAIDALLPPMRADLSIAASYVFREEPPLACPIFAFGATNDASALTSEVDAWAKHTLVPSPARIIGVGHFFFLHPTERLIPAIAADIERIVRHEASAGSVHA